MLHIRPSRGIAIAIILTAIAACGPSAETRRRADSVAAAEQTKATIASGEVISARREPQAYFDGARAAFLAKDTDAAAAGLRDGARFARTHADSASGMAKDALAGSADELETLAGNVAKHKVESVKTLDRAFAHAQIAEARFHYQRAVDAWRGANAAKAGAELVIVPDHMERAIVDAATPANDSLQKTVASARTIGSKLSQGATVLPADVDAMFAALDKAILGLGLTITKPTT